VKFSFKKIQTFICLHSLGRTVLVFRFLSQFTLNLIELKVNIEHFEFARYDEHWRKELECNLGQRNNLT